MSHGAERERVERVYRGYAADDRKQRAWDAANAGNRAIRAELVAAVRPAVPEDGIVLDVGCGAGWWLERLARDGVGADRLAGVELQAARAEAARRRVPGADVRVGDGAALPWPDDAVAMVTLFTVLSSQGGEEIRRATLREARRVVRPGGVVAVWEPRVPTGNRETAAVRRRLLAEELGPRLDVRSLTLLPPLARRLSPAAYGRLVRLPVLRTHRLALARV